METTRINQLGDLIRSISGAPSPPPAVQTEGYSGAKVLSLLCESANLLPAHGNEAYVEIGVYRGLTLTNVAASLKREGKTAVMAVGIDNFAQFDPDHENESLINGLIARHNLDNVTLWNEDYESALENWKAKFVDRKIGVFFVDGPHDYRSQLLCLLLALPHLSDEAIIIIDDCNYPHVRLATRDFLRMHPDFKLALEAYTPDHPMNLPEEGRAQYLKGWWDGIHVLARDPNGAFATVYPDPGDARSVCEAEHVLQSRIYRNHWLQAVPLLDNCLDGNYVQMLREGRRFSKLLKGIAAQKGKIQTLSQNLPESRPNPTIT